MAKVKLKKGQFIAVGIITTKYIRKKGFVFPPRHYGIVTGHYGIVTGHSFLTGT